MNKLSEKYDVPKYIELINSKLSEMLYSVNDGQDYIIKAMDYSLSNGGKRIRPVLTLEFCRACGGNAEDALNLACSIEMIHTYSLIHDDLPCMDNDDFRRGKPSCHKAYGEEYALLAGDGLLTLAFETALKSENVKQENLIKAVKTLANLAGVAGMVGGQVLDLQSENCEPSLEKLQTIDRLKTGALIKAAALLGCYASNRADEKMLAAAEKYSECIGSAFQIVDDILDVTSTSEVLGKPVGSDEKNNKMTYVSLMGIENSEKEAQRLTDEAVNALECFGSDGELLKELALSLAKRKN